MKDFSWMKINFLIKSYKTGLVKKSKPKIFELIDIEIGFKQN